MQVGRELVACDDDLLVVLLQVVEDVEKHILCAGFPRKELNVVDDEHINHLVEVDEIRAVVVLVGRHILGRKLFGLHVKHGLLRVQTFGFQSDGVAEVGLSQTSAAIDDQGVERALSRVFGHFKAGGTRQAVAFAFDEVVEGVVFVELRVDLQLFQSRNDEGILAALWGSSGSCDSSWAK